MTSPEKRGSRHLLQDCWQIRSCTNDELGPSIEFRNSPTCPASADANFRCTASVESMRFFNVSFWRRPLEASWREPSSLQLFSAVQLSSRELFSPLPLPGFSLLLPSLLARPS